MRRHLRNSVRASAPATPAAWLSPEVLSLSPLPRPGAQHKAQGDQV